MTDRPEKAEAIHIKNILDTLVRSCRKESDTELTQIREIWNALLSKAITQNAQPAALKDNVLLVKIKSPTLTHQLRFQLNDIINDINYTMGYTRITEIKLKIGNF